MNQFELLAKRISQEKVFNIKEISIIIEVSFNIWKNDYLKTRNNLNKDEKRKLNVSERNRARLLDKTQDKYYLKKFIKYYQKNMVKLVKIYF